MGARIATGSALHGILRKAAAYDTGHWWMARLLLRLITPHPSAYPFVRDWYRAVSAHRRATPPVPVCVVSRLGGRRTGTTGSCASGIRTDGVEVSSHLDPEAVLEAAKRSEAVIYGVTVKGMGRSDFIRRLAEATGGEVFEAESSQDLDQTFSKVLDQFRSRYPFSCSSQGVERRGWHRLEVRVNRRGAVVKARLGYFRD